MKLSYDASWTEDQEVDLADVLELSEKQGDVLFVKHETIVLDDTQSANYENWLNKQTTPDDAPPASVAVSSNVLTHAIEMEKKIEGDAAIDARARLTISSGEETKKGPLILRDLLLRKYGAQGMQSFPEVGSPFKDPSDPEKKAYLPCDNPDRYTVTRQGKTGPVQEPHSFYADYAERTAFGREIKSVLDAINDAREYFDGPGKKSYKGYEAFTASSGYVIDFPNMGVTDVTNEYKMWNTRKSTLASVYRRAVQMDRQLVHAENYPGINFMIAKNKDGTINASKAYPITIQDKESPVDFDVYTPTNFLNFDFELATENGGSYSDLMATVGKAPKGPETMLETIKSAAKAFEYIAELASYLSKLENEAMIMRHLNAKDKEGKFVNDAALLSLDTLDDAVTALTSKGVLKVRIQAAREAEAIASTKQKVAQ